MNPLEHNWLRAANSEVNKPQELPAGNVETSSLALSEAKEMGIEEGLQVAAEVHANRIQEEPGIPLDPGGVDVPAETLEEWREGAEAYRSFWEDIKQEKLERLFTGQSINAIKCLFLGLKPAWFAMSIEEPVKSLFEQHGFRIRKDYIYSPELVDAIVRDQAEFFGQLGITDGEAAMMLLEHADPVDLAAIRGIVLGFPPESARRWEEIQRLPVLKVIRSLYDIVPSDSEDRELLMNYFSTENGWGNPAVPPFFLRILERYRNQFSITESNIPSLLSQLDEVLSARGRGAHGMWWLDYGDIPESDELEQRIERAFRESGIEEVQ